jgi:hypothetical protein
VRLDPWLFIIEQLRKISPYWNEREREHGPAANPEKSFAPAYA